MDREAIEAAYRAWNRGALDGLLALMAPDAVIYPTPTTPGLETEYRGTDGATRWWKALREGWEQYDVEAQFEDVAGELALLDVHVHARGRASGAEVRRRLWHLIEMRGSQCVRHWSFSEHDAAVAKLQALKTERPG